MVVFLGEKRRGEWPVGVVTKAEGGRDGNVREVKVKLMGEKVEKRVSIIRLALLSPKEENEQ